MATKLEITVVNYGLGNIHSVSKALARVAPAARVCVSSDPEQVLAASHVVFPGVGAIADCIAPLQSSGLAAAISQCRQPLLGICVGMQALLGANEENSEVQGLGLIPGEVRRLPANQGLKVPHMGWNQVQPEPGAPLFKGLGADQRFYFVHSYYCAPEASAHSSAACRYGVEFSAAVQCDNFFGVQFHPEKSSSAGLQLLANFLTL